MLFNSFEFIAIFLPITIILYYLPIFKSVQLYVLLLAGFVFYGYNHGEFLVILLVSGTLNAVTSYMTHTADIIFHRRLIALSGVLLNLGLLAFFKYGNLLYNTFVNVSSVDVVLAIPLPIGISFYTFQGISLLVDVMKNDHNYFTDKKLDFKTHFFHTLFFISFFPHSVAGPIVKSYYFLPQIEQKNFCDINFEKVFKVLVTGFFFKTVIADNIQNYTFWMEYPYFKLASSVELFVMMIGFSVQIFADFAGYSLIAIGIAALYGYHLPDNFNFPYISTSFKEFWKRWHMSLSAWLQEYLYISLGGNRKGKIRTYLNLILVMLLGGLWHGAAWNYLAWGGVHGGMLAIERVMSTGGQSSLKSYDSVYDKIIILFRWCTVFLLVSWAWLFFKLPDFTYAMEYTVCMFTNWQHGKLISGLDKILYCCLYGLPVALYHWNYKFKPACLNSRWEKIEPVIYGFMLFMILANGGSSNAFIYFQF